MARKTEDETTVVVIDDEESMCEGCRQALEEEGYRAEVARDGEQGLRLVEHLRPNVVLVDLKMPGMSGMEVLGRIREIDPSTVSIVITGYGTVDSAVEAMKLGARDYIRKPFDEKALLGTVRRGVQGQRIKRSSAVLEREKEMALDNFAGVICHQLRSPVAAASQWIEAVTREMADPLTSGQKSMLERAYERLNDLTKLMEDWLELARVEAGVTEFETKAVDLAPVIKDAWQTIPDADGRWRVLLQLNVEDDVRPVLGNNRLLRELFTNLFSNSVKFSSGPGKVTVDIAAAGSDTVISIADTGIGIPEEELPHLFEPFYRGTRSGVKRTGGSGLGLAIAKKIVSVHGGTISAKSDLSRGTIFTLRIPAEVRVSPLPAPPRIPAVVRPGPTPEADPDIDFWEGKTTCWEMCRCPEAIRNECPTLQYRFLPCWEIEGTYCKLDDYGKRGDDTSICQACPVYKKWGSDEPIRIKLSGKGIDSSPAPAFLAEF